MGFLSSLFGGDKNGKIYKFDKDHNVYYKGDGVTIVDAATVAGYLKGFGYFKDTNSIDVQISSPTNSTDSLKVSFIVNAAALTPDIESAFYTIVSGMKDAFPNRRLAAALLDTNFKEVKDIGYVETS